MIDLQKFCADGSGFVVPTSLLHPWSKGEHTYACNGHFGIRVPRRDDVTDNPHAPDFPDLIAKVTPSLILSPIPAFPDAPTHKPCRDCGGNGILGPCEKCDGKGEYDCGECGRSDDCSKCEGSGFAKLTTEAADKIRGTDKALKCEDCEGSGIVEDISYMVRLTDFLYLAPRYLAIIRELPGVLIDLGHDGANHPVYFKFDGGDGVIMPMRGDPNNTNPEKIIDARPKQEAAE